VARAPKKITRHICYVIYTAVLNFAATRIWFVLLFLIVLLIKHFGF